ncbi:MAG: GOLPH3/VPS74 family protein [Fidelibacterota bacterium]
MIDLALHEKFVLLTINDEKGTIAYGYSKSYGFAGILLMELYNRNLVEIKDKKISFTDKTTDSSILNDALKILKERKKPPKINQAIHLLSQKMHKHFDRVIERLVEKDILKIADKKVLWLFNVKYYPTQNPEPENLVKSKIKSIVLYGDHPDPESLCLISLIHVLDLYKEVFSKEEKKKAKKKVKEIVKEQKIAGDIQNIIQQEIMIAVNAGVTAATIATTN